MLSFPPARRRPSARPTRHRPPSSTAQGDTTREPRRGPEVRSSLCANNTALNAHRIRLPPPGPGAPLTKYRVPPPARCRPPRSARSRCTPPSRPLHGQVTLWWRAPRGLRGRGLLHAAPECCGEDRRCCSQHLPVRQEGAAPTSELRVAEGARLRLLCSARRTCKDGGGRTETFALRRLSGNL